MVKVPELITENYRLREIVEADVNDVFLLRSDPILMKYIPRPLAVTPEDSLAMIRMIRTAINKAEAMNWAICFKEDQQMIGTLGFVRINNENRYGEIGYMLKAGFQRKGIIRECMKPVLDYGFGELKLNRIEAITDPENLASNKLLLKCGFKEEGILRSNLLFEGNYYDANYYSILKSEYLKD